jgi:hypothetical protein
MKATNAMMYGKNFIMGEGVEDVWALAGFVLMSGLVFAMSV